MGWRIGEKCHLCFGGVENVGGWSAVVGQGC